MMRPVQSTTVVLPRNSSGATGRQPGSCCVCRGTLSSSCSASSACAPAVEFLVKERIIPDDQAIPSRLRLLCDVCIGRAKACQGAASLFSNLKNTMVKSFQDGSRKTSVWRTLAGSSNSTVGNGLPSARQQVSSSTLPPPSQSRAALGKESKERAESRHSSSSQSMEFRGKSQPPAKLPRMTDAVEPNRHPSVIIHGAKDNHSNGGIGQKKLPSKPASSRAAEKRDEDVQDRSIRSASEMDTTAMTSTTTGKTFWSPRISSLGIGPTPAPESRGIPQASVGSSDLGSVTSSGLGRRYQCPKCDRLFLRKGERIKHVLKCHLESCVCCGDAFLLCGSADEVEGTCPTCKQHCLHLTAHRLEIHKAFYCQQGCELAFVSLKDRNLHHQKAHRDS